MFLPYIHQARPLLLALTKHDRDLAAQLRRDVEVLATDIGPRGTFAPDRYKLAADFLDRALSKAGYTVARMPIECHDGPALNLEAVLPGIKHPDQILIVGAHYDSVEGCPAANDNGSGVAGVLAIARAMAGKPRTRTVKFVLFANEEPPYFNFNAMGSQEYARKAKATGDDIRGMVCLETIGCYSTKHQSQSWPLSGMTGMTGLGSLLGMALPSVGDFIALVGPTECKDFIREAATAFERQSAFPMLAAAAPAVIDQVNWSDHRGFIEAGYPAFMVTDTAPLRYPYYHTPQDTADRLDYESMARVVHGLIGMVEELADVR